MNSTKRVKLETPIGSIESDSGNHLIDLISVLFIIVIVLLFKTHLFYCIAIQNVIISVYYYLKRHYFIVLLFKTPLF